MKTYKEFLAESIQIGHPSVMRIKKEVGSVLGDAKFSYTSSNNKDSTGFAINNGQVYVTWDSATGTASVKQTRAAGGKMIDTKLNVAEKDVAKLVRSWLK